MDGRRCPGLRARRRARVSAVRLARKSTGSHATEFRSLAVLTFHSIGEPKDDPYLEFGLADALITRLSAIRGLAVRPLGAVRRFASTAEDPVEAGRQLKVEAVLDGTIQRRGNVLRISARLLDVRNGTAIWSGTLDERVGVDALVLEDALSSRLLAALASRISSDERDRFAERRTTNPRAFQLYVEGRYFFARRTAPEFYKAVDRFERAVAADPNYALAWAGLADARMFCSSPRRPCARRSIARCRSIPIWLRRTLHSGCWT